MTDAFHLGPDELDLWLDGRLSDVRASHLETCQLCRACGEELREVVALLKAMPQVAPGPAFADRVMARVGLPVVTEHLTPADLDLWVVGGLPLAREGHLRNCPDCQKLADAERTLVLRLEALPLFSPRPGFTDRIMDQVDLPATSIAGAWHRWRRGVARHPLTVGAAAGVGGLIGGSIAASIAWTAGNQDTISGAGTWLLTHGQAMFWQSIGTATALLEQQSWYPTVRAGLTPGRMAALGTLTLTLYAAGVLALRRLIALPSPGAVRALS